MLEEILSLCRQMSRVNIRNYEYDLENRRNVLAHTFRPESNDVPEFYTESRQSPNPPDVREFIRGRRPMRRSEQQERENIQRIIDEISRLRPATDGESQSSSDTDEEPEI